MKTDTKEILHNPEIAEKLNKFAIERAQRYENLNVRGVTITSPYFQNFLQGELVLLEKAAGVSDDQIAKIHESFANRGTTFAWGRGKGKPEELEAYISELLDLYEYNLQPGQEEGLKELCLMRGVGVDCSGYVYELLRYSFEKLGVGEVQFIDESAWDDPNKTGEMRAGARIFAASSGKINPKDIQPLDLIIKKDSKGIVTHIAIILQEGNSWVVSEATLAGGARTNELEISDGHPNFKADPHLGDHWNQLYKDGHLEFRRLNIFKK
jgi:hypothetical protein